MWPDLPNWVASDLQKQNIGLGQQHCITVKWHAWDKSQAILNAWATSSIPVAAVSAQDILYSFVIGSYGTCISSLFLAIAIDSLT